MKQNRTEWPAYMVLSLLGVIIVGIMIYYTKDSVDAATSIADEVIKKQDRIANEYANYEITMYDGEEVRGDMVISFIKKQLGDYSTAETSPIFIEVVTVVAGTTLTNQYINKEYISDIKNFSSTHYYIKPTAFFYGEVIKTANNAILGVRFIQK